MTETLGKWSAYHPSERAIHQVRRDGKVVRTIQTDLDPREYRHLQAALTVLKTLHPIDGLYVKDVPTDDDLTNRSVTLEMADLMVGRISFLLEPDGEPDYTRKFHGGAASRQVLESARRHFQAMLEEPEEETHS